MLLNKNRCLSDFFWGCHFVGRAFSNPLSVDLIFFSLEGPSLNHLSQRHSLQHSSLLSDPNYIFQDMFFLRASLILSNVFCLGIMCLIVIFLKFFFKFVMERFFLSCDKGSFLSLHPRCFPNLRHSPLQGALSHNAPQLTWATWCSYWL